MNISENNFKYSSISMACHTVIKVASHNEAIGKQFLSMTILTILQKLSLANFNQSHATTYDKNFSTKLKGIIWKPDNHLIVCPAIFVLMLPVITATAILWITDYLI